MPRSIDLSLINSLDELKNKTPYQGRTLIHELIELNLPKEIRNIRLKFNPKKDVILELPYILEDEDYSNLLIVACSLGRVECIKEIKDFGLTFRDALMCLYAVPQYMTRDIMDVFRSHYGLTLDHMINVTGQYENVLFWLVVYGADKKFEELFDYILEDMDLTKYNLLASDENGNTIFHHLLRLRRNHPDSEDIERMKLFLIFCKRVGITFLDLVITKNNKGKTPFHFIKNTKLEMELMPIFDDYERVRDDYSSDDEKDYKHLWEPYCEMWQ